MAGYRIEFNGSLIERKNLVQSNGNSSLVAVGPPSVVSPVVWDTMTPIQNNAFPGVYPNSYTDNWFLGAPTAISYAGGIVTIDHQWINGSQFITPDITTDIIWEIRWRPTLNWVTIGVYSKNTPPSRATNNFGVLVGLGGSYAQTATWRVDSGTFINSSNQALMFQLFAGGGGIAAAQWEIDYIKISTPGSAPVTILPATNVEGVAPTGGVVTIPSPSTLVDGQGVIAGAPKLFGARVVHDSSDIMSAKYLPPADVSEDAEANARTVKIITATSTSLSVESDGLGSAERLGANDTSLIVEEHLGALEN